MANSRNASESDACFTEFKDVSKDLTGQALTLLTSHMKHEPTANVNIKVQGTELHIDVSGFSVAQLGSDTKALEVQSCILCNKNCYSSSDEESGASVAFKIAEVQVDIRAHVNTFIYSPMPVNPKRGCMSTSQYILIITQLKELLDTGDFAGHEQMVEKQMAKLKTEADFDMEMSLLIERAKALYYQNSIKDAKKILKAVVKQKKQLKNPGILEGRALNLLTAIYKRQNKLGNAMECVERARTCLEGQDSAYDKAELHHSHGALITAMPTAKEPETVRATKEEAYKSYLMALRYKSSGYVMVKMAALILESPCIGERSVDFPCKDDVMEAKNHLDSVESWLADKESLGTQIKFLQLRSDQYRCEHEFAMAMDKAREALTLAHKHEFKLEVASAESRIDRLSVMMKWWERGLGLSADDYLAESESTSD